MKNKITKLSDVAAIISGAAGNVFSREPSEGKVIKLLVGSNMDQEGNVQIDGMENIKIAANKNVSDCLLQEGDVVVMARGSGIRAGFVGKSVADLNILASANFIIIRTQQDKLHGEVLAAYLNSPIGKDALQSLSVGATIEHISASKLKDLGVPVPSMQTQGKIVELFYAGKEAYESTLALAEQQKLTATTKMMNLLQEAA